MSHFGVCVLTQANGERRNDTSAAKRLLLVKLKSKVWQKLAALGGGLWNENIPSPQSLLQFWFRSGNDDVTELVTGY